MIFTHFLEVVRRGYQISSKIIFLRKSTPWGGGDRLSNWLSLIWSRSDVYSGAVNEQCRYFSEYGWKSGISKFRRGWKWEKIKLVYFRHFHVGDVIYWICFSFCRNTTPCSGVNLYFNQLDLIQSKSKIFKDIHVFWPLNEKFRFFELSLLNEIYWKVFKGMKIEIFFIRYRYLRIFMSPDFVTTDEQYLVLNSFR